MSLGVTPLGASYREGRWHFLVWAPKVSALSLVLVESGEDVPMHRDHSGYFSATVASDKEKIRYFYRLPDGMSLPDPATRAQPEGVHGPSEASRVPFQWRDSTWFGIPLREYIIYELHVGTFTAASRFDAAIAELPRLKELGITAIEIMPVAQFPGERNWGYDGVGLYAVQNSYGGAEGFKRFVNAAHQHGLAVVLDVVYNHLGPEGNYLDLFGYYFTSAYKTPWGRAINYDHAHSHHVRRFFIENALFWQEEFHIDALRLDAVHAIYDQSARPFLRELAATTELGAEKVGRRFHLIAESDLNASRFVLPRTIGGYGLSAQWSDDFHHCLHVLLTGEQNGYYSSYTGGLEQFAKVWREGFAFTGEISKFRNAPHGERTHDLSFRQFVVCAQNHDQVGNRMLGERLPTLVDPERLKLAAATVLLSPFTPLLFMGEEYGETAPFQYFANHLEKELVEAVRKGRKEEFSHFFASGEAPDPFELETFQRCKLNATLRQTGWHKKVYDFYRALIAFRKSHSCFTYAERHQIEVLVHGKALLISYDTPRDHAVMILLNFSDQPGELPKPLQGLKPVISSSKGQNELGGWGVLVFEST